MSPKITVTLGSNRPGGLDISLAGLCAQTFQDFEVVFVDGRYHKRHAEVRQAVRRSGLKQPFFHVPNYRDSGTVWGSTCVGYNTGFMLAAGEIVVMLLDYAYAPPGWLAAHVLHQQEPKAIMAPHEYRTLGGYTTKDGAPVVEFIRETVDGQPPEGVIARILTQRERFDEISIFLAPFKSSDLDRFPREESDAKCGIATGALPWTYFNTKNESFPRDAVLAANGMDENYDRGRGPGDPDLGLRLTRLGFDSWNVQEAVVHCLNPRRILPNLNIVIPDTGRLPAPHDDRWFIGDGYAYFEGVKTSDAVRAPNAYEIREKRKGIWHWRELSQEEAPIPRNLS